MKKLNKYAEYNTYLNLYDSQEEIDRQRAENPFGEKKETATTETKTETTENKVEDTNN